ncbi:response regulator [Thalassobellus suaedae]|uniref:Response regulator n=1 Tax=Thalassobellus suaedae TaxID=3074124 RepID=A0ABY9Y2J9_9FLAO|nr:response regulator [Flavobacteriaceae bacterium HL-DH10]
MNKIKNLTLVDDDDVFVLLTKIAIKKTNLVDQIMVFSNGLDALIFLKEMKNNEDALPEIIFLDLSMPIMDGWQFLEEFSKLHPKLAKKVTIYICSSSISPRDILRAKTINEVSDYIIKPITKDKLKDIIHRLN